jgi:hypothetical protein
MSPEIKVGNTGDLVASYCSSVGLGIAELSEKTGLKEEYLQGLVCGKREFSREGIVAIIEVLGKRMEEIGQGDNFTFKLKRELLESAGFGLVAGNINSEDVPPGCVGGMPVRTDF